MSGTPGGAAKRLHRSTEADAKNPSPGNQDKAPAVQFLPPLKPHPRWALVLGILLALWIIALTVLYFTTVWPHRHDLHSPVPAASAVAHHEEVISRWDQDLAQN